MERVNLQIQMDRILYNEAREHGFITNPRRASALVNMALKYFLRNYKRGGRK